MVQQLFVCCNCLMVMAKPVLTVGQEGQNLPVLLFEQLLLVLPWKLLSELRKNLEGLYVIPITIELDAQVLWTVGQDAVQFGLLLILLEEAHGFQSPVRRAVVTVDSGRFGPGGIDGDAGLFDGVTELGLLVLRWQGHPFYQKGQFSDLIIIQELNHFFQHFLFAKLRQFHNFNLFFHSRNYYIIMLFRPALKYIPNPRRPPAAPRYSPFPLISVAPFLLHLVNPIISIESERKKWSQVYF